ncbi:hypothetical protein J6590_053439 [Homalodisca vitripennis]|nr:hypothetical protein J6590_053439 [Homalodisca vitripennis]
MRTLLSPLLKSQSATAALPVVPSTPVAPPVLDCCRKPVCSTPALDLSLSDDPPGTTEQRDIYNKISEDPVAEISRLRIEIERLETEYQKLLNHTIESDTRLLEFTDQIFQVNASRVDQSARASATVDCGVQCEPSPTAADFGTQCDLSEQSVALIIRGDSHARHIAGLVSELTAPGTSVDGVCLPGAKLLDILNSDQTSPRPGTRCEVLIAGTNDLAGINSGQAVKYLPSLRDIHHVPIKRHRDRSNHPSTPSRSETEPPYPR